MVNVATARALFDDFLAGKPVSRPLYVPLLDGLAARIAGLSRGEMTADPATWAGSLAKAADLFSVDAAVLALDDDLTAGACRAASSGGEVAALAAARHLFHLSRPTRGCAVALSGPMSLAGKLFGEEGPGRLGEAKQLLVELLEELAEARPDVVLFLEPGGLGPESAFGPCRRAYNTLRNVCSYYDVPMAVFAPCASAGEAERHGRLDADVHVVGSVPPPSASRLRELASGGAAVGVAVRADGSPETAALVRELRALCAGGDLRVLVTTVDLPDEAPAEIEPAQALAAALRET